MPCILVSTISASRNAVVQRLGKSPELSRAVGSTAVIVRIDDSFHGLWNEKSSDKIALDLDSCLARLLTLLAGARVTVSEVQLDYDCPVGRLDSWANAVRVLSRGSLQGKQVWITSLPAHIAVPAYASRFRGIAAGHILQLFDTGLSADQATLGRISSSLKRQGMPFRIGVGAFERARPNGTTDHRTWFSALAAFADIPGYQGVWIFPGGREWINAYPLAARQ